MLQQQLKNLPQPYPLSFHKDSGAYLFQTDQNLIYSCAFSDMTSYFSPVIGVYDIEVHDFQFFPFDPEPEKRKTQDPRVAATVLQTLDHYFNSPLRVLVYFCDSSDNKAPERQVLFQKWHKKYMADTIQRDDLEIHFGENKEMEVRGGILYRKDFPHKDVLHTELTAKVEGMVIQKFGG